MIDHITGNATFSRVVEVIVSPRGETKVQTKGFTGTSCRQASADLEQALGTPSSERLTAEYYQAEPARTVNREGQA